MRNKVCRMEIRLSKKELDLLDCKVQKAGMTRADFIRKLIADCEICEAPPVDFINLIRETKRIGSNIEQILRIANAKNLIDVPRLRRELDEWDNLQRTMWNAYRPV